MGTRQNFIVPGGASIDSTTLRVDDTNNRVGINLATPTTDLDVAGSVKVSGTVTVSGQVAAASFSGSGVLLTSIPNTATTATASNTPSAIVARDASGDFAARTITATSFSGSGATLTSIPNTATTATALNTASSIVARDASGNFAAGTITATSFSGSGAALTGIPNSATTATALSTPNSIVTRGASNGFFAGPIVVSAATVSGSVTFSGGTVSLTNATSNAVSFAAFGVGVPQFATESVGTKIVLFGGQIGAAATNYAIGIASSTLWQGVPTTAQQFQWYGGTTPAATLTGSGSLTTSGSITASGSVILTVAGFSTSSLVNNAGALEVRGGTNVVLSPSASGRIVTGRGKNTLQMTGFTNLVPTTDVTLSNSGTDMINGISVTSMEDGDVLDIRAVLRMQRTTSTTSSLTVVVNVAGPSGNTNLPGRIIYADGTVLHDLDHTHTGQWLYTCALGAGTYTVKVFGFAFAAGVWKMLAAGVNNDSVLSVATYSMR